MISNGDWMCIQIQAMFDCFFDSEIYPTKPGVNILPYNRISHPGRIIGNLGFRGRITVGAKRRQYICLNEKIFSCIGRNLNPLNPSFFPNLQNSSLLLNIIPKTWRIFNSIPRILPFAIREELQFARSNSSNSSAIS